MNFELDIKPLSVNEAWRGKRFKTDKYKSFENACLWLMPNLEISKTAKLKVNLVFSFSNVNADIDNPTKMVLDCLQKKYEFNDRNIYELEIKKQIVKKGFEKIEIAITEIV